MAINKEKRIREQLTRIRSEVIHGIRMEGLKTTSFKRLARKLTG